MNMDTIERVGLGVLLPREFGLIRINRETD